MKNYNTVFIRPDCDIKTGLKQMDDIGEKNLFVVSQESTLIGSVTDGDIRRFILKNGDLCEPIEKVMNKMPVTMKEGYSTEEARNIMLSELIEYIPVINEDGEISDVIKWSEVFSQSVKKHQLISLPVVIMAGGRGSRLSPFTKILPKSLIPLGEKPIIEHIIDRFVDFGCNDFYITINYKGSMIKSYFNDFKQTYSLSFIEEQGYLGTAGSLYMMKDQIHSTFFLSNCDILIDADYGDILEFHRLNGNKITIIASLKHYKIPYGICKITQGGKLVSLTEKPEYEFLVNTGLYVMEPSALSYIPENSEYNMNDLVEMCVNNNERIGTYPISEKSLIDTGQMEELDEALKRFNDK